MKCTRTNNVGHGFSIKFTIDAHDIITAVVPDDLDRRLLDVCGNSDTVSGIALGLHTMARLIEKGAEPKGVK